MHSYNSKMGLAAKIAFNGVLSMETIFFIKVLYISIATYFVTVFRTRGGGFRRVVSRFERVLTSCWLGNANQCGMMASNSSTSPRFTTVACLLKG